MALAEDKRLQLDKIVGEMEKNKEPEASIRFVIDDFKKKHDAPAPAAETPTTDIPEEEDGDTFLASLFPRSAKGPSMAMGSNPVGEAVTNAALDVLSIPSRAIGAAAGSGKMSDEGTYAGREGVDAARKSIEADKDKPFTEIPGENPADTYRRLQRQRGEEGLITVRELGTQVATDPLSFIAEPIKAALAAGKITRGGAKYLVDVIKKSGPRGEAMVARGTPAGEAAIARGAGEDLDALATQVEGEVANANKVAELNDDAATLAFKNKKKMEDAAAGGGRKADAADAQGAFKSDAEAAEAVRQSDLEGGLGKGGVIPVASKRERDYSRGQAIVDRAAAAREAVGARTGAKMKSAVTDNNVGNFSIKIPPGPVPKPPKWAQEGPQNRFQQKVMDILDNEIGYNPAKAERGKLGESVVGEKGIAALKRYYAKNSNIETFDDLVLLRQDMGEELFSKRLAEDGDRVATSKPGDLRALERLYNSINEELLAPIFAEAIPDQELAAKALTTWLEAKESYSGLSKGIERLRVNLENKKEDIIGSLNELGVDNYKKLVEVAKTEPEVQLLLNEMKGGLTDAIAASATKAGELDYKAAKKAWDEVLPETKEMLFPPDQITAIDDAFRQFEATEIPVVPKRGEVLSPLPDTKARKAPEKSPRVGGQIGKNASAIAKKLEKVADPDQRYALQEIYLLDLLAGRKGPESLAERATAASQARMIGMRPDGSLPKVDSKAALKKMGDAIKLGTGAALTAPFHPGVATALAGLTAASAAGALVRTSPYLSAQTTRALVRYAAVSPSRRLNYLAKQAESARNAATAAKAVDAIRRELEKD